MAITYTTLVATKTTAGSIANWVNNDSFDATSVLTMAEAEIWRRLRIFEMLERDTGTFTISQRHIVQPSLFEAPRHLWITGQYRSKLAHKTLDQIELNIPYDSSDNEIDGLPTMFSILGTNLVFDKPPDIAYPYALVSYKSLAPLSGSNLTNILTTKYPRLLINACLMIVFTEFLRDLQQATRHENLFEKLVNDANVESDHAVLMDLAQPIVAG